MGLNENSTNIPYTLGRLFSVYEAVQENANPGINATIKDKYFNSAAATPATIFPILDKLCQQHLRKLEPGRRISFDRQIGQLKAVMGESNPARLTLPEQLLEPPELPEPLYALVMAARVFAPTTPSADSA